MAHPLEDFERSCRDTSRQLRRLPSDVRQALATEVQPKVAVPLAGKVAQAFVGPWADRLAGQTKARKLADPTIVIGGARRVVSGGASARQLVYGNEWGGGERITTVNRERNADGSKRRGRIGAAERARVHAATGRTVYKVRSTQQFRVAHPSIFPTLRKEGGWVLDQFATIVDDVLGKALNG